MNVIHLQRNAHAYRRIIGVGLVCLLALVAAHHLVLHSDDGHCSLCVLLSSVVVVAFAVVTLVAPVRRSFAPVCPVLPPLHTGAWTAWSHRGPPLHS